MQQKEIKAVKRGEIYYFDFGKAEGSIQSGRRPVLVLQADNFNANSPTVIVASHNRSNKETLPAVAYYFG